MKYTGVITKKPANVRDIGKKRRRDLKRIMFIISLMAYPLLQWAIFWLYPNIRNMILPFTRYNEFEGAFEFAGFETLKEQFHNIFTRPDLKHAFWNTFHALAINLIILPVSIIVGYAFSKHVPGEKIFRVLFFIPSIISTVILVLCFRYMFENSPSIFVGPGASILKALHIKWGGWSIENPKSVWTMIYIYCIWAGFSVNVIMISSAMQRIPESLIESCKLEGVGFWRELIEIRIPLIMPTISVFMLNSIMSVTGFFIVPMTFMTVTGAEGTFDTFPWLMLRLVEQDGLDPSMMVTVSTIGFIFSAILMPFIIVTKIVTDKITPDVEF